MCAFSLPSTSSDLHSMVLCTFFKSVSVFGLLQDSLRFWTSACILKDSSSFGVSFFYLNCLVNSCTSFLFTTSNFEVKFSDN